jgi:hypothetical protein
MNTLLDLYVDYHVYALAVVGCIIAVALIIVAPALSKHER